MKHLFAFLALLFLASCGGGGGSGGGSSASVPACATSSVVGRWETLPGPSDVLTLNSDCSGYQSYCAQNFTYTPPTGYVGSLQITFLDLPAPNPGCLAAGTYTCSINYDATNMAVDCGSGISSYTKAN